MVRPFAYDNSLEKLLRNELLPDAKRIEKNLLSGQSLIQILIELAFSDPSTSLKETMVRALADDHSTEYGLEQAATRAKWPAEKAFWQMLARGAATERGRGALCVELHHFYETNLREINLVRAKRLQTRKQQRVIKWATLPTISALLLGAGLVFILHGRKFVASQQVA